jgi:flagellar protein FlaG
MVMEIAAKPIEAAINYGVPKITVSQSDSTVKSSQGHAANEKQDSETVEKLTEKMNNFMESLNIDIQFSLHEKTNRLIVQVVDKHDGTVLKEFPTHEFLDTIANIQEYVGMLLDKKT